MTLGFNGITHHGMYKLWPMVCPVEKPFEDNGKFIAKKKVKLLARIYLRSMFVSLPWHYQGDYKFHIGPSFHNNMSYWRCDAVGLYGSFCRLACKRFLDKDITGAMHDEYESNQENYFLTEDFSDFRDRFLRELDIKHCDDDTDQDRIDWVYAAHPKKKERVTAYEKLLREGKSHLGLVQEVEYVSKSQEWLPNTKFLRGTGNLGVISSMAGGYLAAKVKEHMKTTNYFSQVEAVFTTVVHEELGVLYDSLYNCDNCVIGYFSDDGVISARCSDGRLMANLDVSQCDGSMGEKFLLTVKSFIQINNWKIDVEELFRQLQLPMRLRNPLYRSESFLLGNKSMVLYSGSTLTTICNNFVHLFIAREFSKFYSVENTVEQVIGSYEIAARNLGFMVKVQRCYRYCDYQFLKTSPVHETYIVNIACHLRSFGFSKGDIPGKRKNLSLEDVGRRFLASIVQGRLNWGNTSLLKAFVDKYKRYFSGFITKEGTVRDDITRPIGRFIHDHEWLPRYKVEDAVYHDFLEHFRLADIGDCIHHEFIDSVMSKDY